MFRQESRYSRQVSQQQQEVEEVEVVEQDISEADDLNLRRIRKGFRLESVCWD